jgi:hypothetical protein
VAVAAQAELKGEFWKILDVIDQPPGEAAVAEATRRAEAFATKYHQLYPAAARCLGAEFETLAVHLRFPRQRKRIRHSNLIEPTFGETRRRTKVIGRLPGESSCVSLVWAVPDRASRGWRGVNQTPEGLRLQQDLRRQLLEPPVDLRARRAARRRGRVGGGDEVLTA